MARTRSPSGYRDLLAAVMQERYQMVMSERGTYSSWQPPTDVLETDDHVYVVLELPGVRSSDIRLRYEGGNLIVNGFRQRVGPPGRFTCHQLEMQYGPFERAIPVHAPVRLDDSVEAEFADGILVVPLPKATRPTEGSVTVQVQLVRHSH